MTVRTRFAPSPTGYLHIGGVRTALYNWLYARKHGGQFILRIEDTDRQRSTQDSIDAILKSMEWLGLDYDEGPFYQTERFDRYQHVLQQLLTQGKAYRCICTRARLAELRETQEKRGLKPRYDGYCRDKNIGAADNTVTDNMAYVIRFRNPEQGEVVVDDQVFGPVSFSNTELDDLIIARNDGTPTYNFTVVVDDWDMKITHVIRGDDHLNNTPRQINLLKALGAQLPVYAHVPMILGRDKKRLSKRHGAVSVLTYRDEGFLPQALLNYLVRLGWSHGDQEIFSLVEMTKLFDIKAINRAPAVINPEKLLWLNQHYMKEADIHYLADRLAEEMQRMHIDAQAGPTLADVARVQQERTKTIVEMAKRSTYFYQDITEYDEKAASKNLKSDVAPLLNEIHTQLAALKSWKPGPIHEVIIRCAEQHQLKLGKVAQPVRVAVTGNAVSPPIDVTLALLGRDKTLARLQQAIEFAMESG